ncbi:MAG TPA: hypothetical protein VKA07_02285, partial [Candidatus Sulfotelmatobacter sp.]|nr:hypothetical protein [Candidatus Sulfotelmatobacter sp.]
MFVLKLDPRDLPRGHRQFGGDSLKRLQAGHLVRTDRVGIVVLGQLGCLEVTIADGLDLLLELHRVLLRRVQPVAAFVGL